MLIAMILGFLYGVGFLIYASVTNCDFFLLRTVDAGGASFSDYVLIGNVLHFGLWLAAIWGLGMILLIPRKIFGLGKVYNTILISGCALLGIVLRCVFHSSLENMHMIWKLMLDLLLLLLGAIASAPLWLSICMGDTNSVWLLCLFVIFVVFLTVVFLLSFFFWLAISHPVITLLLLFLLLLGLGGGGYTTYVVNTARR